MDPTVAPKLAGEGDAGGILGGGASLLTELKADPGQLSPETI